MITILLLVMFVALCASGTGNVLLGHKVGVLENSPVEKVEYREIEVIKKAVCECDHPSSMHIAENTDEPNEGGCQQELFSLPGTSEADKTKTSFKTKASYKCYCVRYVGPEPFFDVFDERMRELETHTPKELR